MKKLIVCLLVSTFMLSGNENVSGKISNVVAAAEDAVSKYMFSIYNQINFKGGEPLPYEVFEKAFRGYLNLKAAGKLNDDKQLLTVADLSQSSCKTRLWIIDLREKKVLINDYVAHGQGSGDEYARLFSNTENSHQTSLGFYVTGATYIGDHGLSLRLHGMDNGYNSAAFERDIVVHGADYVSKQFISTERRLGRSWGCPAVSNKIAGKVIDMIKDGTCLFLYYPQKRYLSSSFWLNKKIEQLPEDYFVQDMFAASNVRKANAKYVIVPSPSEARFLAKYNYFTAIRQVLP